MTLRQTLAVPALSALLVLGACQRATSPVGPGAPEPGTVRVEGLLTAEGVECPAMRGNDGRLYTLSGDLRGFRTGDRVVVDATVAEMSFCMQGITLVVKSIRRA